MRAPASVHATTDSDALALERPSLVPLEAQQARDAVELLAQLFVEAARKCRPGAFDRASGVVVDGAFPGARAAPEVRSSGVTARDRAA